MLLVKRLVDTAVYHQEGAITNSYSTGAISGNGSDVGGLIGYAYGSITNSYATGSVTNIHAGGCKTGGLIGGSSATVINSYSVGLVSSGTCAYVGGLIGHRYSGTVTNSFWDTENSGQATSAGAEVGKTTAELKTQATFTDASWDFTTIWQISADVYPTLK